MENKVAVIDSQLPGFMRHAFESLEGMNQIAKMYADSRTIPDHFYEKVDNKPNYSKPKIASIQAVLTRGYELQLKPSTALQGIIPINGLLSLKVDLMKSMIFSSGTMASGGWIEKVEGDVDAGTYKVTITGKRKDNEVEMSRSFSIQQAKRAGLWVTQEMIQGSDGWKHKKSAWWKYNYRMIGTRAAGFLCRDLWGDVIDNSVSFEEARDYPEDTTVVIETNGTEIIIPDQEFTKERSKKLTGTAAEKIDAANPVQKTPEETPPATQAEPDPEPPAGEAQELPDAFHWTGAEMEKVKSTDLEHACKQVPLTGKAIEIIPGKKTNKKLRTIILAFMAGKLEAIMGQYQSADTASEAAESMPHGGPGQSDQPHQETPPEETVPPAEKDPDDFMEPAEGGGDEGEVAPNLQFDGGANYAQTPEGGAAAEPPAADAEASIPVDTNKHNIEVPELGEEGGRPFEQVSQLYMGMQSVGITNQQFDEANAKMLKGKYKNMEEFCKIAPVGEINVLLNSIG